MKRATTESIRKAIQPFITVNDRGVDTIKQGAIDEVMDALMAEFSGIYCGVEEHRSGDLLLVVTSSARTKKKFYEVLVDEQRGID